MNQVSKILAEELSSAREMAGDLNRAPAKSWLSRLIHRMRCPECRSLIIPAHDCKTCDSSDAQVDGDHII